LRGGAACMLRAEGIGRSIARGTCTARGVPDPRGAIARGPLNSMEREARAPLGPVPRNGLAPGGRPRSRARSSARGVIGVARSTFGVGRDRIASGLVTGRRSRTVGTGASRAPTVGPVCGIARGLRARAVGGKSRARGTSLTTGPRRRVTLSFGRATRDRSARPAWIGATSPAALVGMRRARSCVRVRARSRRFVKTGGVCAARARSKRCVAGASPLVAKLR
jgi:hypothetical protein